jgi:hypothetical protein
MSSNTKTDSSNQTTCQCEKAGTVDITEEGHHFPLDASVEPSWLLQNKEYILDSVYENRFEPVIQDINDAMSMLEKHGRISVTDDVAARIQRRLELWNERIHEYEDVVKQSRGREMNGRAPQYYYDTDNEMIYVIVESALFDCDCDVSAYDGSR